MLIPRSLKHAYWDIISGSVFSSSQYSLKTAFKLHQQSIMNKLFSVCIRYQQSIRDKMFSVCIRNADSLIVKKSLPHGYVS